MKPIKCALSISRPQCSDGSRYIEIRVHDRASTIEFLRLQVSREDMMDCLTGLSRVEADGEARGLEFVGLKRVVENRSIQCPLKSYDREVLREWLQANGQEDGWILDGYLGSQNSIVHNQGEGVKLNYSVHKFVEMEAQP